MEWILGNALYKRSSHRAAAAKLSVPAIIFTLVEDDQTPITARCDFFEHSEKYVLSKKAELWSADNEEFLYLVDIPHLTLELYEKWRDYIQEDGDAAHPSWDRDIWLPILHRSSSAIPAMRMRRKGIEEMPHLQKFSFFTARLDGPPYRSSPTVHRTD